ncbi:hypothetical protein AB0J35_62215 [Nonomuraea angiospora]|uniref:hypothetical protein n=1 Tax=Nonomuraea angiospora TaxID=46172 RepID=UPI00343F460A
MENLFRLMLTRPAVAQDPDSPSIPLGQDTPFQESLREAVGAAQRRTAIEAAATAYVAGPEFIGDPAGTPLVAELGQLAGRLDEMEDVDSLKTRLLTELIPNGREAEFTVQQIFDAHLWVLESLRVDRSVTVGDRLLGDFRLLARSRGERLELRMPTAANFTRQGGWPVLVGVQ